MSEAIRGTLDAVAPGMRLAMSMPIALIAPLAACAEPSEPTPTTSDVTEALTNTPCATLPADYIFYVPETFYSDTFPSGSGSYGYIRNSAPSTCAGYIVDVYMATYSALNPDSHGVPTNPGGFLVEGGGPYDLPSSNVVDGTTPVTKEDCNRLSTITYAYTWPHTDTGYTYVGGTFKQGSWSSGSCTMVTTSTYGTIPKPHDSTSSWDKYRFVVNAFARTSYQEADVSLALPPPS